MTLNLPLAFGGLLVGVLIAWVALRRTVKARPRAKAISGDNPAVAFTPGPVVYLTGLSGAGKSTIAEALAADLRAEETPVEIVDGDVLRARDATALGFDRTSRELQMERAARMSADIAATGATVISALISPFDAARRAAREVIEASGAPYHLVYVSTPIEVAEARDPKGHYKRFRAGEIREMTGIDSPYESPTDADLVIDTTTTSVEEAVARIRAMLEGTA